MAQPHQTEPRWRRLPEERPRQIIDAAVEVFGEHGLADARLEDIAKRAGIAKGTIYLYFPNKEALFREMVHVLVISEIELAEQRAAEGPATDQLREYLHALWRYLSSRTFGQLYRLTMSELHRFPDLLRFYVEEVAQRSIRLTSDIIRRGVDRGEFRAVDPMATSRILHAIFIKHGVWAGHRDCNPLLCQLSDEQVFEQLIDFAFHALMPAAAPRGAGSDS